MKMRPNMGRPENTAPIQQVRQTKLIEYVQQLERQNRLLRQGLVPNSTPMGLKSNLDASLPPELRPGNVGEIMKVIWPYWFPSTPVSQAVVPGQSARVSFTVTQEAAFIMTSLAKVVHYDNAGIATYIDPANFNTSQGQGNANDLSVTIRDASSSRDFQALPFELDHIGDPQNPTSFPTPMLIRENGTLEFQVINSSLATTYYPKLIAFGYRIRIDAYEKILSGVTG